MDEAQFLRKVAFRCYQVARRCSDPSLVKKLTIKGDELLAKAQALKPNGSVLTFVPGRRSKPN
jgi:hypothetical protein